MKILVFGGSASGKSEFAENLIVDLNKNSQNKLIYLATLDKNSGGDTKERIEKHKKQRAGKGFETIELENEIFNSQFSTFNYPLSILVEDLGNLVSRIVFEDFSKNAKAVSSIIMSFFDKLFENENLVIVGNDIFLEKIDLSDDGMKKYFEVISFVTNYLSKKCDKVIQIVAGIPIELKNE